MVDVIVVGAGASGLCAAEILTQNGRRVLILEGRNRIGGRIFTTQPERFSVPVELGAEFIHGDLPLTGALAARSGTNLAKAEGKAYSIENNKLEVSDMFPDMEELMKKLHSLKNDVTMGKFLNDFFGGEEHTDLREAVTRMAEGLDCADIDKVSAISLRDEWNVEEESKQYHPVGGYGKMVETIAAGLTRRQVQIRLEFVVREIKWKRNHVEVISSSGECHLAKKIIITIPPALIKRNEVKFSPPLSAHSSAFQKIETGGVIKFLVEFDSPIWEQDGFRKLPQLHFLFSDAFVPTWWTQPHQKTPLLTGWLSGPRASACTLNDAELRIKAYDSLAYLFDVDPDTIKQHIKAVLVINWVTDPFSRGAYVYRTPESSQLIDTLSAPVDHTIFFAGEFLYKGPEMGTVEAALASGRDVAGRVMNGMGAEEMQEAQD